MKTEQALKYIAEFKGSNLKAKLVDIKHDWIGKTRSEISEQKKLYEAALIVKKVSSQIDEMVHAIGIINCLPKILEPNETIEDLSLAAGSDGEGFDLVTNKRIAEFKFARWQGTAANGMRKRQVFADLVNLYLFETKKKKELYVFGADRIRKYFQSDRASWIRVLSKSGGLDNKLSEHLKKQLIEGEYLNNVFSISQFTIIDIDKILN